MHRPTPHLLATIWTPDEAAECLRVSRGLYIKLWELTAHYKKLDYSDCGPSDVIGINCVSEFWEHLSAEDCVEVNAAFTAYKNQIELELSEYLNSNEEQI